MFGFICKTNESEWWVRRKEKGNSDVIITEEMPYRTIEHTVDYVLSMYCECPDEVKTVARKLKEIML